MAASHRSPSMRDKWRADDSYRDETYHRERGRRDRQERSPAASYRRQDPDIGLKIRGTAKVDTVARSLRDPEPGPKDSDRSAPRRRSRSPRRRSRGEGSAKLERPLSQERPRPRERRDYRREGDLFARRRRSRSRSLVRESHRSREERRRSRSPVYSARTDRGVSSRRLDRAFSPPPVSPRIDHYSSTHEDSGTRAFDSYIPGRRPRSRSPLLRDEYRPAPSRRRSPSPDRRHRPRERTPLKSNQRSPPRIRERSPPRLRDRSPDQYISKDRAREVDLKRRIPRSREVSLERQPTVRPPRKRSPLPTQEEAKLEHTNRARPRSPEDRDRPSNKKKEMYSSGYPNQNIPDGSQLRGSAPMQQGYPMQDQSRRPPPVNTQHTYSASPQWTPVSSHHASPHSASPYGQGQVGWGGQQQQYQGQPVMNAYSPPYRQNSFPPQYSPQSQYYPNQQSPYNVPPQQAQPAYQSQPYRGGHAGYRGGHFPQQDRRFSGSGPQYGGHPPRGRGTFQNLQWTPATGTRGGRQIDSNHSSAGPSPTVGSYDQQSAVPPDEDNPFRPSKDLQVEDQSKTEVKMQPPKPSSAAKESKISFAFKSKSQPAMAAKPVSDLSLKMKDPPRKENLLENSKSKTGPRSSEPSSARSKLDTRDGYRTERSYDRRERDYRDEPRARDERYDDREYYESRSRHERRPEREHRRDRERERSPEKVIEKIIKKRLKPRPTLPPELAESKSVYYRKPGNESVVGSGTYGKVFKAVHVYTKELVALKKIRMEGEKDGFPVTAVREIKLLQSLKHENVVCLQEVMVEHNDCFMVFEYLSHDLTGLLNHPTFKLEHSHKKHLGKQLFEGLNCLHRRGVLHRDIKAANILVSNTGQLKLADFGLARFFSKRGQPDYTNRVITIWYRSPELLLGETQYGPAVDIWSAACVMIEIFTRHAIFPGDGGEINQLDKIYNVLGTPTRSEWPQLVDMAWFELLRPAERKANTFAEKYQERLTPAAFELLQAMFLYDPAKRPTAGDVLEHPYFTTEEPAPRQAVELKDLHGDWHEFESKALRKENERKAQDARRAVRIEEHQKEKEKRRASGMDAAERDPKRQRPSSGYETADVK